MRILIKLTKKFSSYNKLLKQRGQSLLEFVLLLTVIVGISYTFVFFINRTLGKYWEYSANLIINDRPGVKSVNLR